jgi:protein AroM
MGKLVGLVTIGQSPRRDGLKEEISQVLGSGFEVIIGGALDGLSREEIADMAPEPGDYVLISLLSDGSSVHLAKKHILAGLQRRIDEMNERRADVIALVCTGVFPKFASMKPVVYPQTVVPTLVKGMAQQGKVGVITPLPEQIEQERAKWNDVGLDVVMTHADPYGKPQLLDEACARLSEEQVDLAVLECFGHSLTMKERARRLTGKPVVLVRSVLARVIAELA